MELMEEGQGSSEMESITEIETTSESLDSSAIFHVIKNVVGFILYMHQQIPSILQDLCLEFEALQTEYKELETGLTQNEVKGSTRRKHISRMREVKHGIRRFDKLMKTVSSLETMLQLIFSDFAKSKSAEVLSRKAIRDLISKGAGSGSYPGPTKLFLLVKAPSSLNMPLHFLPKRDFRYSKKIVPYKIRFKCKTQVREMVAPDHASQICSSTSLTHSISDELIWYQCRHVIKGIAFKTPVEE
ncbi:hypothetical protein LWI28_027301 [Acer negundo]|uniref:Uncharacterized protein n=1 Tax=Acer negundo TaxID=4023 RepID=A0AAD5J1W9_ACENE|nr:hypothetical protein LWI28_027301 [Acer negundo]KAK4849324.1 hypothetical protein QYF36_023553 [Acer negundo]